METVRVSLIFEVRSYFHGLDILVESLTIDLRRPGLYSMRSMTNKVPGLQGHFES